MLNNSTNTNSTDANGNGNGQAEDGSRDDDDIDRTANSSSKRRRRSNDNDDESKAKVDKDTDADEEQQTPAEEQKVKEDSNKQLGPKTPVLTKTYDGGSTSNDATDSNRSTNDPWPRDCNGRRRTRLSTEQHVSTILDNLNLN